MLALPPDSHADPTHSTFPPRQASLQSCSCSATPGEQPWSGLASLQNDYHPTTPRRQPPARTRAPHPHPHSDTCPGWGTALLTSTATAATADTLSQLQEELTLPIIKPTELQPFTTSTWVGGQPFPPALPPQLQVGLCARHNGTALSTRVPAAAVAQSQQVGECKSTQGTPLE